MDLDDFRFDKDKFQKGPDTMLELLESIYLPYQEIKWENQELRSFLEKLEG